MRSVLTKGASVLFLVIVVAVQARAFGAQLHRGFRPFASAPTRVPFSWDMFAVEIQRCGIEWHPALPVRGGIESFASLAPTFEWYPVFDHVSTYRSVARVGCQFSREPTHVRLSCVTGAGETVETFGCR